MTLPQDYELFAKTQGSNLSHLLIAQDFEPDEASQADLWMVSLVLRIGFWALFFWIRHRLDLACSRLAEQGLSFHRRKTITVVTLLYQMRLI